MAAQGSGGLAVENKRASGSKKGERGADDRVHVDRRRRLG
jgi:hypothetical protein